MAKLWNAEVELLRIDQEAQVRREEFDIKLTQRGQITAAERGRELIDPNTFSTLQSPNFRQDINLDFDSFDFDLGLNDLAQGIQTAAAQKY